jgi:hypothetical protein
MSTDRLSVPALDRLPPTAGLVLVVLLVETAGRWLLTVTVGLGVRPTGAVVAVVALLLGPAAAPGVFLGTLLAGLATSGITTALAGALGVTVGVALAGVAATDFGPGASTGPRGWALRYAFLVSCAVCIVAATTGLLSDISGLGPFQLVTGRFLTTNLPLALAVGPVVWYVSRSSGVGAAGPERGRDGPADGAAGTGFTSSARRRAAVFGVVSVGWVLAGYAAGFLFRATERVPAERIGDRLVPAAGRFLELVGPRGILVQVLLGVLALSLLAVSARRSE